ncbi:MAG: hypothetical protein ACTSUB_00900 [Candidatus Thorarchaeota archaeon]
MFRRKKPKEKPIIKQMKKLHSSIQKGKKLQVPEVPTRQDAISLLFDKKMESVGIVPSTDSGHIPTSQTPLARYLRKYGVADLIIDAISAGLIEEESESSVRDIIEAAADTPDVNLEGMFLDRAIELAIEEWNRRRRSNSG